MGRPHRTVAQTVLAQPASDGAGVRLSRALGNTRLPEMDPFLMLDEFRSDDPGDYITGFPDHPHRGFETITIMLAGAMEHRDSRGNRGRLGPGSVQWMTAASGIVHSEMPQQENGLMWGFQLWLNLPAADKMKEPAYQDIEATDVPVALLSEGVKVRVIGGQLAGVDGPVRSPVTQPYLFDVTVTSPGVVDLPLPSTHNCFVYVYAGRVCVDDGPPIPEKHTVALAGDGSVCLTTLDPSTRFLVVAGKPLGEPVARYGPFVMNTHAELERAFADYQAGRLR